MTVRGGGGDLIADGAGGFARSRSLRLSRQADGRCPPVRPAHAALCPLYVARSKLGHACYCVVGAHALTATPAGDPLAVIPPRTCFMRVARSMVSAPRSCVISIGRPREELRRSHGHPRRWPIVKGHLRLFTHGQAFLRRLTNEGTAEDRRAGAAYSRF